MNKTYMIGILLIGVLFLAGCGRDYCEFNNGNLFYRGPCKTVNKMIDLEEKTQNFEAYKQNELLRMEDYCSDWVMERIYTNAMKNPEYAEDMGNASYIDWKKMTAGQEDIIIIVSLVCGNR